MASATGKTAVLGLPGRLAMVFGLTGVAITQPALDLLGRNPEFFVAGHYEETTIVLFVLLIALAPGSILGGLLLVADRVHPTAGSVLHTALMAGLGALFGNVVSRGVGVDRLLGALVASAGGALLALALLHAHPGRLLLQYLAVGNVLFVATFAFMSPAGDLLFVAGDSDVGVVEIPQLSGPVVVVILDEFPVTTLLTADGAINGARFPSFARLAESSTWFRNASSRHALTHMAVPALLTGRLPAGDDLPTYRDHPRNLLTLFGGETDVERYELVTDLCPPDTCDRPPAQRIGQALRDAYVVYAHRVLPARLRADLPAIDHSWGGFANELGTDADAALREEADNGSSPTQDQHDAFARWKATPATERSATGQATILVDQAEKITADARLHMIHVALPHFPWILSPWGARLMEYPRRVEDPADPAYDWSAREQYQLHSMQAGAADAALGRMIAHLETEGIWENSTIVVVSDHGIGLTAPDFGRTRTDSNQQELFRIPMFIKAPRQVRGEVRDEPAQSIDLLPSLIDLLDIETDWDLEGHSLFDGSEPTIEPLVGTSFEPALEVVRRHLLDFPRLDWAGLAAVGENADLVGMRLADMAMGDRSEILWSPDHEEEFDDLPTSSGAAPQLLTGTIKPRVGVPPELVVAVNGTIGGTTGGYQPVDEGFRFTSFLGPYLRDGANEIRAFVVEVTRDGPVLHEVG